MSSFYEEPVGSEALALMKVLRRVDDCETFLRAVHMIDRWAEQPYRETENWEQVDSSDELLDAIGYRTMTKAVTTENRRDLLQFLMVGEIFPLIGGKSHLVEWGPRRSVKRYRTLRVALSELMEMPDRPEHSREIIKRDLDYLEKQFPALARLNGNR